MRAGFAKDPSFEFEYYTEYLDLSRFGSEAYEQRLATVLSEKYAGRPPHLIVSVGPRALYFIARWGVIAFPGVPVVYSSVLDHQLARLPSGFQATGVPARYDMRLTLEMALHLRPSTRRAVVVVGASDADRDYLEHLRKDVAGLDRRLTLEYWVGLPMRDLLQRVATLPDNTVVFCGTVFRDGAGRLFIPREAVELVAKNSAVPVFSTAQSFLGHGIVGGHLDSFEKSGVRAAEYGLRVLHGERPLDIPPSIEDLSTWMFDARELKRWGIRENTLPPGSVVRFRQPSLWRERPWTVFGAALFFLAETLLIVGLVVQRRWRLRAEDRHRLLSAIVESSNDAVIGIAPDRRITSWNKGAQAVFGYSAEEVMGRDVDLLVPPDRLGEAHKALDEVMAGGTIAPFETVRLKKDRTPVDVSISDSPINDPKGRIIGISSTQREITDRMRAERAVRASEEKFRQFFKEVLDYCYIVSPQGEILDINTAALAAPGYEREEIVGKPLATIYAPESHARMKELFAQWTRTGLIVNEEMVIITKTGERRAVILNVGAE